MSFMSEILTKSLCEELIKEIDAEIAKVKADTTIDDRNTVRDIIEGLGRSKRIIESRLNDLLI